MANVSIGIRFDFEVNCEEREQKSFFVNTNTDGHRWTQIDFLLVAIAVIINYKLMVENSDSR
jgi:hypothetical protein